MKIINHLKLKNKLILMLLVPLLGMVIFSVSLYRDASLAAENASKMSLLSDVAIAVNRSIESIQNELDTTSLYIKAYTKKYGPELEVDKKTTDKNLNQLNQTILQINDVVFSQEFTRKLQQVNINIAELPQKRVEVSNKKLKRNKAEAYYRLLIDDMLSLIEMIPRFAFNKDLANITSAYASFLRLKSLAGVERQILSSVFKRDQFLGKEFNQFNKSVNAQNVYQRSFLSLASDEEKDFFKATLSGEIITKSIEMRDKAFIAADYGAFNIDPAEWLKIQTAKLVLLNRVAEKLTRDVKQQVEITLSSSSESQLMITLFSIFAYLLTVVFWWIISKGIGNSVSSISHIMDRIAEGDLKNEIVIQSEDEFGHLLGSLKRMQLDLKKKIDKEALVATANARVKQALDNVSASVMVADHSNEVIYINEAALSLFSDIEESISSHIPGFKASEIVGSNIDKFHKNPAHQQAVVNQLKSRHKATVEVGTRTLSFIANPVLSDSAERLGTVVEWQDLTEEVKTESEIQTIVESVLHGDLLQKIDTHGKTGFFLKLSEGINEIVSEVSGSLTDINKTMSALSHGDLTQTIGNHYQGTFESVANNVNETINKLGQIVAEISQASVEVSSMAQEILDGNNSLSSRTEHQASALEETASSMEQITSTVKQNSDNAQIANTLSAEAREMADKGGQVVDSAINAMDEINASSEKIAEIISVIDEIAFQTNLLALNASVEAARAGEQGRGFAVVATEVRNLAGRSATAAKEIKELIQDSVQKVNAGSELVNKSGSTLKEIVKGVQKVTDIVAEIASASQEQSTGIEQVNAAVISMDETTQQNAALAEQTSASSVALGQRTGDMSRHLGFFSGNEYVLNQPQIAGSNLSEQKAITAPAALSTKSSVKQTVSNDFQQDEWEEF